MDPYAYQQQVLVQQEEKRNQHRQQQPQGAMGNMYMQQPMHHPQQHMNYPMQQQQPMMMYPNDVSLGAYDASGSHLAMPADYGYYDAQAQPTSHRAYHPVAASSGEPQSGKRHAPRNAFPDYKTPPQFLYVKDKTNGTTSVASTETQMRNLRVGEDTDSVKSEPSSQQHAQALPGQIDLDMNVLSKLLGKDPSQITTDQIRSILSNPDLLNIYKKLLEEDQRKQKRLARNRDLAGQRRKRSKELVETYEAEVKELQNILAKSLAHEFGQGDIQTLLEALGGMHHHTMPFPCLLRYTRGTQAEHYADERRQASGNSVALDAAPAPCRRHQRSQRRQLDAGPGCFGRPRVRRPQAGTRTHGCAVPAAAAARAGDPCGSDMPGHRGKVCRGVERARVAPLSKYRGAPPCPYTLHFHARALSVQNLLDLFRGPLNDAQLQKFVQWTRANQRVIQLLQFAMASDADKDVMFEFPADL
ncbi:hypothetical protein H310_01749 [Aphanomyces invadans]|uniref:BZIP domain-containing protein n=1 Tax=Aphanomyces invadans TaxID=157072 RepID=A0A024ULQ3_9STRA|nr:hypothetical protein H310_01749 [Aphanomyces invadans]ETW07110.1 hypothetical protein H310_01749 [Aphanomyces invadans]|eukprot:XP_008863203.1 hypothetical protein H310_01749 [Aphanomyces invadans]